MLILFVSAVVLPFSSSQPAPAAVTYGETWDQSCSQGRCTLTAYPMPRYYQEAGTWKVIDESFKPCLQGFCVDKNLYQAAVSGNTVTLTRGQDALTFTLLSVKGTVPASPAVAANSLSYDLPGATLTLTYLPALFKEEIILASAPAEDVVISYSLSQSGPSFQLLDPWACDALGACLVLPTATQGSVSAITVPLDWLAAKDRAYPVTIDPSIALDADVNGHVTKDNLAFPASYNRSLNPTRPLKVGKEANTSCCWSVTKDQNHRATMEFSVPIPANATVAVVVLTTYVESLGSGANTNLSIVQAEGNSSAYPDTNSGNKLYFADLGNGSTYNTTNLTAAGFVNWTLAAGTDVESAVDDGQVFAVGFFSSGESQPAAANVQPTRISAKDDNNASRRPKLTVAYTATITTFTNGLEKENLTFTGNENITRWLDIPKDAVVLSGTMNLTGFVSGGQFPTNPWLEIGTPDGTFEWIVTGSYKQTTGILSTLSDGTTKKNLTFANKNSKRENLRLPKNADIFKAVMNVSGFSLKEWSSQPSLATGLNQSLINSLLTIEKDVTGDGNWTLLQSGHDNLGNSSIGGYYWNGTGWTKNDAYVNGLPPFKMNVTPPIPPNTVPFYIPLELVFNLTGDDRWVLIVSDRGNYSSFFWNGTLWEPDNSYVVGLKTLCNFGESVGPRNADVEFNLSGDGNWSIVLDCVPAGLWRGGYWSGAEWKEKDLYVAGLPFTNTEYSIDIEFNPHEEGVWEAYIGYFTDIAVPVKAFYWNEQQWIQNDDFVIGDPLDTGKDDDPEVVFNLTGNNEWAVVIGSRESKNMTGFTLSDSVNITDLTIDTGNDAIIDISIPGQLISPSSQVVDLNITALKNYMSTVCTTSACTVPLNISTATGGKLGLSAINVSYINVTTTPDFSAKLASILPACVCTDCQLSGNVCSVPFLFHSDTAGMLEYSALQVDYT